MHVANLPSRKDTKLCGFFSYNSTKQMLENPTYFLRRKQTFHVRILVLTRLDGQLITLLSHFPALRGSLYLHIAYLLIKSSWASFQVIFLDPIFRIYLRLKFDFFIVQNFDCQNT